MTQEQQLPQADIEITVGGAIEDGVPGRAAGDLGQTGEGDLSAAMLEARRAEALFHQGRCHQAVDHCRRALPSAAYDRAALQICAWIFSNAHCHEDAAHAYRLLLQLEPERVELHRHLSGSLAALGRLDEAIEEACVASDCAPSNGEFALHAATLLTSAKQFEDGAPYLQRAAGLRPEDPRVLLTEADVRAARGERREAAALALHAAALPAASAETVVYAAELLMREGEADRAAELLRGVPREVADARIWRALSTAEMLCDRIPAALDAVEAAIAEAPETAEYHVHRAHLLGRLGEAAAAAAALARAARLDPADEQIKRALLSFYLAAGLVTEATAVGGDLLQHFPDHRPAAEAVLHLLTHRLDTIDGEYVVLSGTGKSARPPRSEPALLDRLRTQARVINALIIRETRTRFGESRLGYAWALIEPILHITLLSVTFAVLMHGQPPIGGQFFIFYYTGLIPYHVFVHTSSGMSHAVVSNGPLLQLPLVTVFDVIAARGLLELATDVIIAMVLLVGFAAIGLDAVPDDIWGSVLAIAVTAGLGCGLGYINAMLTALFRSWDKTYAQVMRVLYFISGIFYVPGMMPDWARDTLAWNPLLHAIDWFRAGFFASYQPHWLDRSYLIVVAIGTLLAGLAVERGLRRRLSVPL